MKTVLKLVSGLGLALTVLPSFLVMTAHLSWGMHARLMFVGMVLWFATAPFWMMED